MAKILSLFCVALFSSTVFCNNDVQPFSENDCSQPPTLEGPMCNAYLIRYYWSEEDQKCVEFVYGGCRGTANNFASQRECELVAGRVCRSED